MSSDLHALFKYNIWSLDHRDAYNLSEHVNFLASGVWFNFKDHLILEWIGLRDHLKNLVG